MKTIIVIFAALIVGTLASPVLPAVSEDISPNAERIITRRITRAINQAAQDIRDAGLDPYELNESFEYELPVPVVFAASALVDNLVVTGLSNIVVNRMDYSPMTNRLKFTITLPQIRLSIDNSGFEITFLGDEYKGSASGSLSINRIRLRGNLRFWVSLIRGISLRSIQIQFDIVGIESNLNLNLFGFDLSDRVNTYFGTTLPTNIRNAERDINRLFEIVLRQIIEDNL